MNNVRNIRATPPADLYQFVYGSRFLKYVIVVMMLFFLLHPAMPVFAAALDEGEQSAAPVAVPDDVAQSETTAREESAPEADSVVVQQPDSEVQNLQTIEAAQEVTSDVSDVDTGFAESVVGEVVSESEEQPGTIPTEPAPDIVTDEAVQDPGSATNEQTDTIGTEPENENAVTPGTSLEEVDPSEVGSEEEVMLDEATLPTPEPEFYEVVQDVAHNDNVYQFTKQQCVSMGAGAYHCFDADETTLQTDGETLFVQQDDDGDKEIYMSLEGNQVAITDNQLDDDAPFYDPLSDTIVWHRLEGGQYQVYSYQDRNETLLSGDYAMSMEPHRSGDYTVWQSWINESWQVVLHDGTTARVISDGTNQNIAPQVEGAYVIWNVTDGSSHRVAVYEIATGLTSLIDDTEGARVYNPRFVLVYDTKFDNGDVVTKGYDAETGTVVPLAAAAPVMPQELPDSDQTGETRALLQNKSPSRDDTNEELDTSESANTANGTTTATSSLETNESVADLTVSVAPATTTPNLPLTDFDIIVEPYIAATSTQE